MNRKYLATIAGTISFGLTSLVGPGFCLCAENVYKDGAVKDGGTIRGTVRFVGNSSKAPHMEITKDPDYCGKSKVCPRLCVGPNGGVQNAVICLEGIDHGKKFSDDITPVITQRHCNYEPHVTILPLGKPLEIVNGDPILHNVHAYDEQGDSRTIFNIAQPIKGQRTPVKMKQMVKPGLVLATCDAGHPWMSSFIVVAGHPYYAVSSTNGQFVLDKVPPGTYRIKMWHEGVAVTKTELENGKVKKYYYEDPYIATKEVTVAANGTATVDFDFDLR